MSDEHPLLARIDACRPESDDAHDAALGADCYPSLEAQLAADAGAARLYARVQSLDRRLESAIAEVPLPDGLLARLQARLAAEASPPGSVAPATPLRVLPETTSAEPGAIPTVAEQTGTRRSSHHWRASAAAAIVLIAAGLALSYWGQRKPFDREALDLAVRQFYQNEQVAPGSTFLLADRVPPEQFPVAASVRAALGPHSSWRAVRGFLGRSGVAYELVSPDGQQATLYVVRLKGMLNDPPLEPLLGSQPPARPSFTDGLLTAAWRESGVAYVLVVKGAERDYRRFVRPATPVA